MKILFYAAALSVLIVSCSPTRESAIDPETGLPRVAYPIDSLFHYHDIRLLNKALGDSSYLNYSYGSGATLLTSTANEIVVYGDAEVAYKPVSIVVSAAVRSNKTHKEQLPATWKSRQGAYAWIPLDSLQLINAGPFYLQFADNKFKVINWEEGRLAHGHVEFELVLEGEGRPDVVMSSQQIIDRKWKVRATSMRVYEKSYPIAPLKASKGLFGDYPYASYRLLTSADLETLRHKDLRIMRNEIFARYHYIFKSNDLLNHFRDYWWYKGELANVDDKLTDIEKQNIAMITQREEALYKIRPILLMAKGMPLLQGEIDLESFKNAIEIPGDIEDPEGDANSDHFEYNEFYAQRTRRLYGLLPDTSRFYGIVWYGIEGNNVLEVAGQIFVTTLDKNGKQITSGPLRVSHNSDYSGDCNSDETYESTLNTVDMTFRSRMTGTASCAGDESDHDIGDSKSGKINKDGTITYFK